MEEFIVIMNIIIEVISIFNMQVMLTNSENMSIAFSACCIDKMRKFVLK
jgi:hypothetical protein